MPDPSRYVAALLAAAVGSAACLLLANWRWRTDSPPARLASLAALAIGLLLGYGVLRLPLRWPPANGLDRLLQVLLPLVLVIEAIVASRNWSPKLIWSFRLGLAVVAARILLHDSIYLGGSRTSWTLLTSSSVFVASAALFALLWVGSMRLAERTAGWAGSVSLALTLQSAGLATMLAGYLSGGAAALPLAGSLLGTAAAWRLAGHKTPAPGSIAVGVVGLAGLLIVSHFFGRLSPVQACGLFFAPLAGWILEFSPAWPKRVWLRESLRLVMVAVPLIAVLVLAKSRFDRDTAPLLGRVKPQVESPRRALPVASACSQGFLRAHSNKEKERTGRRWSMLQTQMSPRRPQE